MSNFTRRRNKPMFQYFLSFLNLDMFKVLCWDTVTSLKPGFLGVVKRGPYIVGSRGASQLGGSLLGIPPGYKANKLISITKLPTWYNKNTCLTVGKHSLFLLFVWLLFYAAMKHFILMAKLLVFQANWYNNIFRQTSRK